MFLYICGKMKNIMETITLKIDSRSNYGKALLELIKVGIREKKGIEVIEEKSPYNPEFVQKVLKSRNSKTLHVIPTDKLWESI